LLKVPLNFSQTTNLTEHLSYNEHVLCLTFADDIVVSQYMTFYRKFITKLPT